MGLIGAGIVARYIVEKQEMVVRGRSPVIKGGCGTCSLRGGCGIAGSPVIAVLQRVIDKIA